MSHDAVGRMGTRLGVAAILAMCGFWGARPLQAAAPLGPWSGSQVAMAGAARDWQIDLPLSITNTVRSYHLVGGYLYALCEDGHVHCIRPDIGRLLWTRRLAGLFEALWQPVVHQGADQEAVVFSLLREAVFLDPLTGMEIKRLRLSNTNNAAVAVSKDQLYQPSTRRRLHCLNIDRGIEQWQVRAPELLELAPLFVPSLELVVLIDRGGTLGGADSGGTRVFARALGDRPEGWLAVDGNAAYAATVDRHLHAVSLADGQLLGQFRLADLPVGGPVLAGGQVYQATRGGLHCFSLKPADPIWRDEQGTLFLARWPERVVVLRHAGQVAMLEPKTGEAMELLDMAPLDGGVSNPFNDAVILASPKGQVVCLRPSSGKTLTLADFRAAEEAPLLPPAEGQGEAPAAEPTADQASAPRTINQQLLDDPLRSTRRLPQ